MKKENNYDNNSILEIKLNIFKPSSGFYTERSKARRRFFCGSFLLFMFHVYLYYTVLSFPYSLVITCYERADLLALLCVICPCLLVTFTYASSFIKHNTTAIQ